MATVFEKRLPAVSPQSFTSNGTTYGQLTIADTTPFKVKQQVILQANTLPNLDNIEIKEIPNINTILVGPIGGSIVTRTDISAYTTALSAAIFADEQNRPNVPEQSVLKFAYAEEPAVAIRTLMVDPQGDYYNAANPLPVQFSATFPNVVKIADGGGSGAEMTVNNNGSINVNVLNSSGGGTVINQFNQVTSVASGVNTTILTYTVPVGRTLSLALIDVTGSNVAEYFVNFNSVTNAIRRTNFGSNLGESINFDNLELSAGTVVEIDVIHNRPYVGDFEARLAGSLL